MMNGLIAHKGKTDSLFWMKAKMTSAQSMTHTSGQFVRHNLQTKPMKGGTASAVWQHREAHAQRQTNTHTHTHTSHTSPPTHHIFMTVTAHPAGCLLINTGPDSIRLCEWHHKACACFSREPMHGCLLHFLKLSKKLQYNKKHQQMRGKKNKKKTPLNITNLWAGFSKVNKRKVASETWLACLSTQKSTSVVLRASELQRPYCTCFHASPVRRIV